MSPCIVETTYSAPASPPGGFLRRLLDLHLEFVDELERELAPPPEPGSEAY
jgi:hypothetical protein